MQPALFLDRDGVLNIDHGYVGRIEDFDVIDGVFDALRIALARGYALIVTTNQSGIARGYFSPEQYLELERQMRVLFAQEGVEFLDIYHCPHHPDGVVPELSIECNCRKPAPGMFLRAAREHGIDMARSIMVGDKESDLAAARAAGVGRVELIHYPEQTLRDVRLD